MIFGSNRSNKTTQATAVVSSQSDDEGWEVVKPKLVEQDPEAKKNSMTLTCETSDVGTLTDKDMDLEVSKSEKQVQTTMDATLLLQEPLSHGAEKNTSEQGVNRPKEVSSIDIVPGAVAIQDLLASLDLSQVADQGSKGYLVVKRNLKTVALLLLLGVFCAGSIPPRNSKPETTSVPPPPSVDDSSSASEEESLDHGLLIETLKARIVQMEKWNQKADRELSMRVLERDQWRTKALSCDHDLRGMVESHSRLDNELKQMMKSLAVAISPVSAAFQRGNASMLATVKEDDHMLPTPEPSPPRRVPHPQLALPGMQPMQLLPKPSIKVNRPFAGIILAPSVAVTTA